MAKTRSYNEHLSHQLKDHKKAATYLNAALQDCDTRVFLLALRDVAEAQGGMSRLAQQSQLNRENLYRTLSLKGNPRFFNLLAVVKVFGLELFVRSSRSYMNEDVRKVDHAKHLKQAAIGGFKGLIASIPYIGSPAMEAWDGYWNSRLQDTVDQLSAAIIRIDEEKIDKEYIESEECADLFYIAFRIRMQSRSEKKAKFILGMLLESVQKNRDIRFQTSQKESFLFILDQLTEEEMDFLFHFSQGVYNQKSKNDIYQIGDNRQGIAVDSLLSKGILREDNTWSKHLAESMLGREFIAYVKILAKHRLD